MHVASTHTYDVGLLKKPDGGIDADAIKAAVQSGLHLIPRYRQRLAGSSSSSLKEKTEAKPAPKKKPAAKGAKKPKV